MGWGLSKRHLAIMSSSESSSEKAPSVESISHSFEQLKSKFLVILEDHFFGNFQHDWRNAGPERKALVEESLPSFESLSDESGSFLVLDGKKVSLDWFRMAAAKASEESLAAAPDPAAVPSTSEANPYAVGVASFFPESADRFNTHRSRSRHGMRDRLLVEEVQFDEETLGVTHKHRSQLATQLDPHYRSEISYRPRIRNFMRVDAIHQFREASRKQFETYYRQEYIHELTQVEKTEKQHHRELRARCTELREALRELRKLRFRSSMRVMDMVKPYYEETARWEAELRERRKQMELLWNRVIQLESLWVPRIKYQNFQYLIMPKQWRLEHDWIHMDENGKLEGYPESIEKRDTANLRKLEGQNDIWAVKKFYEEEYQAKGRPVHAVFKDSASLLKGVAELDVNSMTLLNRLNLLSWVKLDAEKESKEVQLHYKNMIANLKYSIEDLEQKKNSLEKRSALLKDMFEEIVRNPLRKCVENERTRTIESLLYVLYKHFLPPDQRENALRFSGTESFMYIFDVVTQLLSDFDKIPPHLIHSVEKRVRFLRWRKMKKAKKAAEEDQRHKLMAIQLERSLAPRYVKPPKTGKLPRSRLKKKPVPEVVIPPVVTKLDKIFFLAFGTDAVMSDEERANFEVDLVYHNYFSVQFDQFLRSIGYEPDYGGVTRVELRDGPETNFFKRKELIPEVMRRIERWERMQESIKQRLLKQMVAP
ncbi:hypothetical protein pipiens_002500 [Culex pipiens pipiens]|uniref:Uncharacterized protein n=1 Tax=Culex pipiens pipiens TaxID=38569 RepID=A0ABD1DD27_CULPP